MFDYTKLFINNFIVRINTIFNLDGMMGRGSVDNSMEKMGFHLYLSSSRDVNNGMYYYISERQKMIHHISI